MMTFHGGPADGITLAVKRAPFYLRLVVGPEGVDTLDQLHDVPRPEERVSVYVRPGEADPVFIRPGGLTFMGTYIHLPDVDGEALRETSAWRAWVMEQPPGAGQGRVGERTWPPRNPTPPTSPTEGT